jgi:hypothetical protein
MVQLTNGVACILLLLVGNYGRTAAQQEMLNFDYVVYDRETPKRFKGMQTFKFEVYFGFGWRALWLTSCFSFKMQNNTLYGNCFGRVFMMIVVFVPIVKYRDGKNAAPNNAASKGF